MSDEILINMFMKYGYKYITEDRIKGLLYSIKDVNLKRNVIDKIEELNKIREFKELPKGFRYSGVAAITILRGKIVSGRTLIASGRKGKFRKARNRKEAIGIVTSDLGTDNKYTISFITPIKPDKII